MTTEEENQAPSRVVRVALKGTTYKVTWDYEQVLDTIEREKDGKLLTVKNPDARRIINNEEKLYRGQLPEGFEYAPKVRS